jgi:hypothetical protein
VYTFNKKEQLNKIYDGRRSPKGKTRLDIKGASRFSGENHHQTGKLIIAACHR